MTQRAEARSFRALYLFHPNSSTGCFSLSPFLLLAISALGEVTGGEITSASILQHIFAHFCIGK